MEQRISKLEKVVLEGNGKGPHIIRIPILEEKVKVMEENFEKIAARIDQDKKDRKQTIYFLIGQSILILIAVATILLK